MRDDIEGLISRDKRLAAIHEAGHLTVACAGGSNGRAYLLPIPTADVKNESTWRGQFLPLKAFWEPVRPEIGVAGVVADYWAADPDFNARRIAKFIKRGIHTPSDSDLRMIHGAVYEGGWPEISKDLISVALELLRENKTFFEWAVAELMNEHAISDGQAKDQYDELWEQSTRRL